VYTHCSVSLSPQTLCLSVLILLSASSTTSDYFATLPQSLLHMCRCPLVLYIPSSVTADQLNSKARHC
jgi:hypothetical protein